MLVFKKKKNTFVNISKRKFSNVSTLLQLLGYSLFTYFICLSEFSLRQFYFCHISVWNGSCNCSVLPAVHLEPKQPAMSEIPIGKLFIRQMADSAQKHLESHPMPCILWDLSVPRRPLKLFKAPQTLFFQMIAGILNLHLCWPLVEKSSGADREEEEFPRQHHRLYVLFVV